MRSFFTMTSIAWQALLDTAEHSDDLLLITRALMEYMEEEKEDSFANVELRLRKANSRLRLAGMTPRWYLPSSYVFRFGNSEKSFGLWMSTKPFAAFWKEVARDNMTTIEENLTRLADTGFCFIW